MGKNTEIYKEKDPLLFKDNYFQWAKKVSYSTCCLITCFFHRAIYYEKSPKSAGTFPYITLT